MELDLFFSDWPKMLRIVVIAAVVYVGVVAAIRIPGPRALAKMSAYDLIVTIAMGSLVASIPLQDDITVSDGFAAIITYLALQYVLSTVIKRWRGVEHLAKGGPLLFVYKGHMLRDTMQKFKITDAEVLAAVRSGGKVSLSQCHALVLENDGSWSVVEFADTPDSSALDDLTLPSETPRAAA